MWVVSVGWRIVIADRNSVGNKCGKKIKEGFKLQGARYKEGCEFQVARCERKKNSIEYRVSSIE